MTHDPETLETIQRLIDENASLREELEDLKSEQGTVLHVNDLAARCYKTASDHGFWPQGGRSKGEQIALIHSEVSELLEAVRRPTMDEHCPEYKSEEVECADIVIRVLDYGAGHGLRVGRALMAKMDYNRSRPHKHGKSF